MITPLDNAITEMLAFTLYHKDFNLKRLHIHIV